MLLATVADYPSRVGYVFHVTVGSLSVMESAEQRLIALVQRVTGNDAAEIDLDAPLAFDSLTLIELAVRIEEEFGVRIDAFTPTNLKEALALVTATA